MVGTTVGHYEILEELGRGGMGVVYKARNTRLDTFVALKFLASHLTLDKVALERFVGEARAASSIDHPNICSIFDIGETEPGGADSGGQRFIVMAYYGGETLKDRIARGRLSIPEAARIASQIADGLSAAHRKDIVHRDIKPGNIVLTEDGYVKILDFGLAKLAGGTHLTKSGSTLGTSSYMSPEQVRGEDAGPEADTWSLGITLYQMLTGEVPFKGDYEQAVLYAVLNEDVDLSKLPADTPAELREFVASSLDKDPDRRLQLTAEVARDLMRIADPPAPSAVEQTTPESRLGWYHDPVKLLVVFGLISAGVMGLSYAVMILAGLPDWVLVATGILLAIGLPSLLLGSMHERRQILAESDQPSSRSGIRRLLTVRNAVIGGFAAFAGLILFTAAFAAMRSAGIGPAASLVSAGVLSERDQLIVADFENRTADSTLSQSVTELFRIDLSQSPVIRLMQTPRIAEALERMQLPTDTTLSRELALEVAAREGAKGVVTGTLSSLADGYIITAELIASADGESYVSLREIAESRNEVVGAVDRLSANLRDQIGESLTSIRSGQPLDKVTTASIEALEKYTQSQRAVDIDNDYERGQALLEEAIRIDPEFAMAHRKLAVLLSQTAADFDRQREHARTAYQLRDRLPRIERYHATAFYFWNVELDQEQAKEAYRLLLDEKPDDEIALANYSALSIQTRQWEEAREAGLASLEVDGSWVARENSLDGILGLSRYEEADSLITDYETLNGEDVRAARWRVRIEAAQRNFEAVDGHLDRWLQEAEGNDVWLWLGQWYRYSDRLVRGKLGEAETALEQFQQLSEKRAVHQWALIAEVEQSLVDTRFGNDVPGAVKRLESVLADPRFDEIAPVNRPYSAVALAFAYAGNVLRAREVIDRFERDLPSEIVEGLPFADAARGAIALADGRYRDAIESYERCYNKMGGWPVTYCGNFEVGTAYEGLGDADAALAAYLRHANERSPSLLTDDRHVLGPTYRKLGELYEARGETDKALEYYVKLAELWKDADAELQPIVDEVLRRIDQLSERQAGEPAA
ncbi:MAG: protein kinase [Rhodothermales bacterium]|nr:protein kinase [Rhodothermales bacterium]